MVSDAVRPTKEKTERTFLEQFMEQFERIRPSILGAPGNDQAKRLQLLYEYTLRESHSCSYTNATRSQAEGGTIDFRG